MRKVIGMILAAALLTVFWAGCDFRRNMTNEEEANIYAQFLCEMGEEDLWEDNYIMVTDGQFLRKIENAVEISPKDADKENLERIFTDNQKWFTETLRELTDDELQLDGWEISAGNACSVRISKRAAEKESEFPISYFNFCFNKKGYIELTVRYTEGAELPEVKMYFGVSLENYPRDVKKVLK